MELGITRVVKLTMPIVAIGPSAYASSKLVENATLKVYEGAPHGLPVTHTDRLNEDLLAFIKE